MTRNQKLIFKTLLATVLLAYFVAQGKVNFSIVFVLFSHWYIVLALICDFVAILCVSQRLKLILQSADIHVSSWSSFKMIWIGVFFNFLLLGVIGSDLVKGYYINQNSSESKRKIALALFIDRVVGLVCWLFLGIVGYLFWFKNYNPDIDFLMGYFIKIFLGLSLIVPAIGAAIVWSVPSWRTQVKKYLQQVSQNYFPTNGPKVPQKSIPQTIMRFINIWLLSFSSVVINCFLAYLCVLILTTQGEPLLNLMQTGFVQMVGTLISAISITPGNLGVGNVAYESLLSKLHINSPGLGSNLFTAQFAVTFLGSLGGGLLYLMAPPIGKPTGTETEVSEPTSSSQNLNSMI